ncbi:hypothetical protein [Bradyrhizobium sp. STM 3561]|uniref:hypothetical protein n=1 Tax=Bradyrhizobium sp. STM 3561 TaxID=578923 RepID=UPI0038910A6F
MADEPFKRGVLSEILTQMEIEPQWVQRAGFARATALVCVRVAEEAPQRKSSLETDREFEHAEAKVRLALSQNPADSFLWLNLYSVHNARYGLGSQSLSYLAQSYVTGPREGWIAVRRNRLGLAVLAMLSAKTQGTAINEFASMVSAGLIEEAASNLTSVGWSHRARLLASLRDTDIVARYSLSKALYREGINVAIPGVDADQRQWFR